MDGIMGRSGGNGASTLAAEGNVLIQLRGLEEALSCLENDIQNLSGKLSPIRNQQPEKLGQATQGIPPNPVVSPVADRIRNAKERVSTYAMAVQYLLKEVEL